MREILQWKRKGITNLDGGVGNEGGEVRQDTHAFIPHLRQCEVNGFCLK